MFKNQILIFDSNDESSLLITGSGGVQQSRQRSGNIYRKSICWDYFKLIEVPGNETVVECTIDGCNTKYVWRGSTSNLLGHIKRKHHVTTKSGNSRVQQSRRRSKNNYKESICWRYFRPIRPSYGSETKCTFDGCNTKYVWRGSTSNFLDHLKRKHLTELKIKLPLIKFIVPSALPLKVINSLKSSGLINLQIELPLEEQINKLYEHLSDQVKSKIQTAKSVMLSISNIYIRRIHISKLAVTCCWLTENFEFNKILLCVKETFKDIIEVLDQWKLKNLKFIISNKDFYDQLKEKYPDIIHISTNVSGSGDDLIEDSLSRWARENISTQGISDIAKAVENATWNLSYVVSDLKDRGMQSKMNITNITINDCTPKVGYFKILSLDYLPVSIFDKLVELFNPLKHIDTVTERNIIDLLVNATSILRRISQCQFPLNSEYKTLESFLKFLIRSYEHFCVSSFLDPRSNPINSLSDDVLGEFVLDKCQVYYSHNPSSSGNNLTSEEFTRYISRSQSQFDENFDVYKWWQNSNHEFPGLATLAREYLLLVSDKVQLNNLEKFVEVYKNVDM
ncbi:20536_t:CDS:2, partial [Racocetra persica]